MIRFLCYVPREYVHAKCCGKCGSIGGKVAEKLCGGCKSIRYCNEVCQREHWKIHRGFCQEVRHNASLRMSNKPTKELLTPFIDPVLVNRLQRLVAARGLKNVERLVEVLWKPNSEYGNYVKLAENSEGVSLISNDGKVKTVNSMILGHSKSGVLEEAEHGFAAHVYSEVEFMHNHLMNEEVKEMVKMIFDLDVSNTVVTVRVCYVITEVLGSIIEIKV